MPRIANATAETEADEIEITPEMIDAGTYVLSHAAESFAQHPLVLLRPIIAEVYEAMVLAGPGRQSERRGRKRTATGRKGRPKGVPA